jgi:hypothetical protein
MAVVIVAIHVVKEAPHVFAPRLIDDAERVASATAMGRGLLPHAPDPATIDRHLSPGRLGENAGASGVVRAVETTTRHMGQTLVGQDNEAGQVVLNLPTLARVVAQVPEDSGVLGDHRSRRHKRQFHHTPPGPRRHHQPGPRVACGSPHGKSTTVEELISNLVDSDLTAETWTRELARANVDQLRDLVLIDKRTNTPVSHRDIGIGISQVLPVLVSAYASAEKILAIEQPEIHLHPALQAELSDVFIESALGGRRNTFILETHSEHLILRIMRRMRDTVQGTLPDGLPPVRPEDVATLYVQPRESAAVVRLLELDEEGELLDPWPGGFFEEGFRERFT